MTSFGCHIFLFVHFEFVINTSTYLYTDCFKDTILPITIIGESTRLTQMAATANGGNVTVGN